MKITQVENGTIKIGNTYMYNDRLHMLVTPSMDIVQMVDLTTGIRVNEGCPVFNVYKIKDVEFDSICNGKSKDYKLATIKEIIVI